MRTALAALLIGCLTGSPCLSNAQALAEHMRAVGHHTLNGHGNGGEGLDMRVYPDGRRVLFYAHTAPPSCFSVVDVTDAAAPRLLTQIPTKAEHLRCNSLGVSGDTMVVAQNTDEPGQSGGGALVYDVSDPANPREIAYFDTSGGPSRGAHYVWFADGRYAYLSSGAPDFTPAVPPRGDDQFLIIVDLVDRAHPLEVGRWWMPGMRKGEPGAPLPRTTTHDGVRMHSGVVMPERADRFYAGWIDGGIVILDISDKTAPRLVGQRSWFPKTPGYIGHSFLPIFERDIAIVTQEANQPKCADWPKPIWTVDISDERQPREIVQFPYPAGLEDYCTAGRFGAHNIHMNRPKPESAHLVNTVVAAFQNAGVRVYSIADPEAPVEIGAFVPEGPHDRVLINDVFVDDRGLIYAADRVGGGVWILEYTGKTPLD